MKQKIIKYLPDIIILLGIFVLTYNKFAPRKSLHPIIRFENVSWELKVTAVMLIAIGIDIVIRRYFKKQ